jgi:RNA polymerase sigma factor (sigma-70 family)
MEPSAAPAARVGGILLRLQSDERLAELASSGSHDAFETLVRRYRGGLLRSCRRILPGDRAEDAVQETLLQAHRALARNGAPERFRPWLHRIAVNTSLRQLNQGGDTVLLSEEMDGVEGPETVQERRERLRSTVGAIDRLPGRQRRALVLRELEGRSHAEIARELGLSGGAVRQLIHRARNTVRSAASALTPPAFLLRMLEAGSAAPIGDAAAGGAGVAVGAKLMIAAVVAGGVAGGAAIERSVGPPQGSGAAEAREPSGGRSTAHALAGTGGAEQRGSRSADRSGSDRGPGGGGEGSSGPGSGSSSRGSGSWGGKSGRSGVSGGSRESGGEIDSDQLESVEDDSSGSGSAEAESEADSSGSRSSGSGSESSGSGSLPSGSSGSGSSGSESSGSGSGSSATISSGSGSSGSGGSGSSGSGSGSDDD